MGADTITTSDDEIRTARNGIYLHLKETTKLTKVHGSLSNAIEVLGLYDFIENQVMCNACDKAWVRFMENIMRKPEFIKDMPSEFSEVMDDEFWRLT